MLKFISDHKHALDPFTLWSQCTSAKDQQDVYKVVFRLFEASSYLRSLWDPSVLFEHSEDCLGSDKTLNMVQHYVKRMLLKQGARNRACQSQLENIKSNLEIDQRLRVNKHQQSKLSQEFDQNLGQVSVACLLRADRGQKKPRVGDEDQVEAAVTRRHDGLVMSEYL